MENPLVSVVMPVYNVENYLESSLESILNQTYKNIELIAVNDGSTDSSGEILKKYKNKSNLKLFHIFEQQNQGLSMARNVGLEKSSGKYIYFFDSDDLLEKNAITELVKFSELNNLDLIRFDADSFFDDNFKEEFFSISDYKSDSLDSQKIYSRDEFVEVQEIIPSSVCIHFYKLNLIKDNNLTFYPGILHEDELFTPLSLFYSKKIGYIDKPFFKRRYREGSIMTTKNNDIIRKHANGYLTVLKELKKFSHHNETSIIFDKYLLSIIDRIGKMIFLSKGLNLKQNFELVLLGVNPFKAFFRKLKGYLSS